MTWRASDFTRLFSRTLLPASLPPLCEQLERRTLFAATFAAAVNTQIAGGVFPVVATATADLNGDGLTDLVVARDNLQAQVFLGTKTGAFTLGSIYGDGGAFVALGDFNNDSKIDLATGNGIYPGVGNGTFGALISGFTIPARTINLYADDVNGDGNLDLVCATYTAGSGNTQSPNAAIAISVLLGNGNGTFKAAVSSPVATATSLTQADAALQFADFNNDGKPDVLTPFGTMIGNGDGTFKTPTALAFKNTPAGNLPASPVFAVGDFNGDANFDLAVIPPPGNTGNVEILLGDGKGNFTDSATVSVAASEVITALSAPLFGAGTTTGLVAGISTSPGVQTAVSDIAVLTSTTGLKFSTPTLYPISGPANSISVVDLNADSNPDILSINGVAGSTSSTGLTLSATAAALLNTQAALVTPVLSLRSSANPVVAGSNVTYTASVQGSAVSTSGGSTGGISVGVGAAIPTGSVTFLNGATALGTAALVNGKASLTTAAAGVGAQSITFTYAGDASYLAGTSTALVQTVLQTGARVPLLLPTLGAAFTIPTLFLRGDSGNATLTLTNGGGAAANGRIAISFYLSSSGAVDASAIPLAAPALRSRAVHLGSGKSQSLTTKFKLNGVYPPAGYFLIAQIAPLAGLTADQIDTTPQVSAAVFRAAGQVFGTVGTHRGLVQHAVDATGARATFTLTGPGAGTLNESNGAISVAVSGTTTSSRLTISSARPFTLTNADVQGALNTFSAGRTTLTGELNLSAGARHVTLGSASDAAGGAVTILLGASAVAPTLSLGNVGTLALTSAAALSRVTARAWQAGSLDAPSIQNLSVAGAFDADLRTHAGGKVASARVGSITGGTWAVAGGVGTLRVIGAVTNANIFVGLDTGPDDTVGTGDDVYFGATLSSLVIGGADASSLIAAGAAPAAGGTIFDGITLLPNGTIASATLRGAVSVDSRILARHLPKTLPLNGAPVSTATDPHFQP